MHLVHSQQRLMPIIRCCLPRRVVLALLIRIRSARALPEKIVFDTTTPIPDTASSPLLAREDVRMNGR